MRFFSQQSKSLVFSAVIFYHHCSLLALQCFVSLDWHAQDPLTKCRRYQLGWGRDSAVGIATRYGLDGPGLWGQPSLLYNGYRVFPRSKAAGS